MPDPAKGRQLPDRWSSAPYRAVTTETTKPPLLGNAMEAWKARGRDLNEIYDALTEIVEEPAPGFDPVADLKALGAQRDRLRAENERLREALHEICRMTADKAVDGSYGILVQFASRVHGIARAAVESPLPADEQRLAPQSDGPEVSAARGSGDGLEHPAISGQVGSTTRAACELCAGTGAQLCECDKGERPFINCFSCSGRECSACGGSGAPRETDQPKETG